MFLFQFLCFLSLALALCCFFLVELRWTVAYFLFFSVFLFLYFLNLWTWKLIQASYFRHHGCRNNFRFPFSLLTLKSKLFLLYKTRVAMRFPAKITSSCIRLPYCLLSYFTLVCLWYGRTGKRTVTWLPKFLGWVEYHIFFGMGYACALVNNAYWFWDFSWYVLYFMFSKKVFVNS